MKSHKLTNLEKKFGMAMKEADEVTGLVAELVGPLDASHPTVTGAGEIVPVEEEIGTLTPIVDEPIFELEQLKLDFQMVRSNLMKLVNTGQRMLESCGVLDLADMKASQLDALSTLQNTIANNLKMMMEIYKDMAAIEKARRSLPAPKGEVTAPVNMGTVNNTQVVFAGSTAELLEAIKNGNGAPQ